MPLCGQGSGRYQTARKDTSATAMAERMSVLRRDSVQPEITTGARMRIEKGFCRPPVRHSRAASSTRSKQRFQNASRSLTQVAVGRAMEIMTLSAPEAAITELGRAHV